MIDKEKEIFYSKSQIQIRSELAGERAKEINYKISKLMDELQQVSEEFKVPVQSNFSEVNNTYTPSSLVSEMKQMRQDGEKEDALKDILEHLNIYSGTDYFYAGWDRSFC